MLDVVIMFSSMTPLSLGDSCNPHALLWSKKLVGSYPEKHLQYGNSRFFFSLVFNWMKKVVQWWGCLFIATCNAKQRRCSISTWRRKGNRSSEKLDSEHGSLCFYICLKLATLKLNLYLFRRYKARNIATVTTGGSSRNAIGSRPGTAGTAMSLPGFDGWRACLLCGSMGGVSSKEYLPRWEEQFVSYDNSIIHQLNPINNVQSFTICFTTHRMRKIVYLQDFLHDFFVFLWVHVFCPDIVSLTSWCQPGAEAPCCPVCRYPYGGRNMAPGPKAPES